MNSENPKKCYGECLAQAGFQDNKYYRHRECLEKCQLIKCPNWELCGQASSSRFFNCHGSKCNYCNMQFGRNLQFTKETKECPVCLEDKELFVKWQCVHDLCLSCFRLNYGWTEWFLQGPCEQNEPQIYSNEEWEVVKERGRLESIQQDIEDAKRVVVLDENGWEVESPEPERPPHRGKCPLCRHRGIPEWRDADDPIRFMDE